MRPRFISRPVRLQDPVYNSGPPKIKPVQQPKVPVGLEQPCGTYWNYKIGCRCEPCREALREHRRRRVQRHLNDPEWHGRVSSYGTGCRCESCTAAQKAYDRERRHSKKV